MRPNSGDTPETSTGHVLRSRWSFIEVSYSLETPREPFGLAADRVDVLLR